MLGIRENSSEILGIPDNEFHENESMNEVMHFIFTLSGNWGVKFGKGNACVCVSVCEEDGCECVCVCVWDFVTKCDEGKCAQTLTK